MNFSQFEPVQAVKDKKVLSINVSKNYKVNKSILNEQ